MKATIKLIVIAYFVVIAAMLTVIAIIGFWLKKVSQPMREWMEQINNFFVVPQAVPNKPVIDAKATFKPKEAK